MKRWMGLAGTVLVGVLLTLAFWPRTPAPQAPSLPTLELTQMDGSKARLSDLGGQPVVVNVWATWCGPCRREMPLLLQAAKAHPKVHFVFANQGEGPEAVRAFEDEMNYTVPGVYLDPNSDLAEVLGFQGLPTTFFFSAEGKLVRQHAGELNQAQLEGYLAGL